MPRLATTVASIRTAARRAGNREARLIWKVVKDMEPKRLMIMTVNRLTLGEGGQNQQDGAGEESGHSGPHPAHHPQPAQRGGCQEPAKAM